MLLELKSQGVGGHTEDRLETAGTPLGIPGTQLRHWSHPGHTQEWQNLWACHHLLGTTSVMCVGTADSLRRSHRSEHLRGGERVVLSIKENLDNLSREAKGVCSPPPFSEGQGGVLQVGKGSSVVTEGVKGETSSD